MAPRVLEEMQQACVGTIHASSSYQSPMSAVEDIQSDKPSVISTHHPVISLALHAAKQHASRKIV